MGYKDVYRDWLSWCDDAEKKELLLLKDEKEIEDRFYRGSGIRYGRAPGYYGCRIKPHE